MSEALTLKEIAEELRRLWLKQWRHVEPFGESDSPRIRIADVEAVLPANDSDPNVRALRAMWRLDRPDLYLKDALWSRVAEILCLAKNTVRTHTKAELDHLLAERVLAHLQGAVLRWRARPCSRARPPARFILRA